MVWVSITNNATGLLQILQKFRSHIIRPRCLNLGCDLPNLRPKSEFDHIKTMTVIKTCMEQINTSVGEARPVRMQDLLKRDAAPCA